MTKTAIRFPLGQSDFKKFYEGNFYFVDKSLFIKQIIDDAAEVILFTRPRRFGKTLNLSMLRYFFEKTSDPKGNEYLFKDLAIIKAGKDCLGHLGKYPVISITFKDTKDQTFKTSYNTICNVIRELYSEHRELLASNKLYPDEKKIYELILNGQAPQERIKSSLKDLISYLARVYETKIIILIDEYDTPIQAGYTYGYYAEIINFMRGFYGAALKDNPYLYKSVLTGILRVAKENIFSGLNNLKVYSILDTKYGEYFGFTEPEVNHLLAESSLSKDAESIKEWYNGYQFGTEIIYNPWSMVNCISEQGRLEPYWINTSENALVKDLIGRSDIGFKRHLEKLLAGGSIEEYINPHIIFDNLQHNETAIWTLFLMSGYLKATSCIFQKNRYVCTLEIPNKEVAYLYDEIVQNWLFGNKNLEWYETFLDHIRQGNIEAFAENLQEIALSMFSYYDIAKHPESFYHGFGLGLIASLRDEYHIESNRESGLGRYDLAVFPKTDLKRPAIVFEFKSAKDSSKNTLQKTADLALKQIDEKEYTTAIKEFHSSAILKVGIAFSGKTVCVVHQKQTKIV